MPERRVLIALILITIAAAFVGIETTSEPRARSVLNVLSMGIVVSAIFYVIVVWLPGQRRKARIQRNLQEHYNAFRSSCIHTFLIASDSQDYHPREMLLEQSEFRRYFKVDVGNGQNRWDVVLKSLNGSRYLLRDIQYEIEILREELLYVLNAIDVHDEEVFAFLKRLAQIIYRMRDIETEYDDIKQIGGFLWELFAGWSVIDGYRDKDIVQSMIERI